MKRDLSLLAIASLGIVVGAFALIALSGCGGVFPKCDDPKRPCPDVHPDYPSTQVPGHSLDGGVDG